MKLLLPFFIWILATNAQQLDVQDLTNNNGYIPIKTGEQKTISYYNKVLHFINLTAYEETMLLISKNIGTLNATTFEDKQLINTINKNYILLSARIDNLHINSKSRRGLFNIVGKGLKIIAGSMDSDDEQEIRETISKIHDNEQATDRTISNLTLVNNLMSEQINNITTHINKQQTLISSYINKFQHETQNRIKTLEDEVQFIQHIYRINNDILLLNNHVEDIGQIIFSCKLGVIPADILTQKELDVIADFDSYRSIKIVVLFQDNNIILTLLIPQFSFNILSKIKFEPLPNIQNKSIVLNETEILADSNNNIYNINIKDNLEKNLIALNDKCLSNILDFKEAQCELENSEKTVITEITQGLIIFKNFEGIITHDCSKLKIKQKGTFLIRFENCKINALNKTYVNVNFRIYDTFVLPNMITKITDSNNNTKLNLKLENLYIKQLQHEDNIKILASKNKNTHVISLSTDVAILILIFITFVIIHKIKQKWYISSNPQIATSYIPNIKDGPFLQIATPQFNK